MRRRLLIVSNLYPPVVRGGYEVECRDVVEHLKRDNDVTVLTSSKDRASAGDAPGVLRELPWIGGLRRRDSALAAVHAITSHRIVARVLANSQPHAVYVWNAAGVPSAALRALQQARLPMLVRVCEYWFKDVFAWDPYTRYLPGGVKAAGEATGLEAVWGAATRVVNRLPGLRVETQAPLPAAVCWNSRFVEGHAPAPAGVAVTHRAIVIPSNARTGRMALVERAPVPGRVLFVGRLDDRKGAATVVRAVGHLRRTFGVDAQLVAVGDGSALEREALLDVARDAGVADRVTLTGPLRGAAFEAEVAAASAWCVPSIWDEPAPLTCTEAALARVPAVFSRVGGIPEMFTEGREALFHAPGDDAGCTRALAVCLAAGDDVATRVDAALARAQELTFAPYLRSMDAFLEDGLASSPFRR